MNEDITKSKDPKLVACRVFLGNLASDRTSREELEEKFSLYGNVLGVSVHQGFAFVQYGEEQCAHAAVDAEQGCFFKGKKLDLRIASEGRKPGPRAPQKRPHDDFGPRRPEFDDPGFHPRDGRMPPGPGPGPGPWEREPFPPEHMLDRERGPEPFREDPFMRDRFGPPPPPVGPPVDAVPRGDSFPGPPPPLPPAQRADCGFERPFDSVIVAVNKHLKMYAEMVERRLIEMNMTVDVIFLVQENALLKAIDDMTRRGVLYIIVVQPQHEERKSITVNIMHGPPQEHRNMPLDDALMMLARNFKTYVTSVRNGGEQPSLGFLLNLLSDGKQLSVAELDRIIAHLQDRRDRIIEAEGGKVIAREIGSSGGNSTGEQFQQRLMGMLSGGVPTSGGPSFPAAGVNLAAMLATLAQNLGMTGGGPPFPGMDAPPGMKAPVSTGGPGFDPNMAKSLDSLFNPTLLKSLIPPAGSMASSSRPPGPFAGPDGSMRLPHPKPMEPPMPGMRPPHPPPIPGGHGVHGPTY